MFWHNDQNLERLQQEYPLQLWANNPILREICKPVKIFDKKLEAFCENLISLMVEYDGVWLAAPQVWQTIRLFATSTWKDTKKWQELVKEYVMINPEIIEKSEELVVSEEACLSLPWEIWNVKRHKKITVEYFDPKWNKKTKKLQWFNSFIVQHELDHLDWVLYIDKTI